MKKIKDYKYVLNKIMEDCLIIINVSNNNTLEDFQNNIMIQDCVCFRIIQISETIKMLDNEYRENHKEIPWNLISGLRNRIVHDYGSVDTIILYEIATNDIPYLYELSKKLLDN